MRLLKAIRPKTLTQKWVLLESVLLFVCFLMFVMPYSAQPIAVRWLCEVFYLPTFAGYLLELLWLLVLVGLVGAYIGVSWATHLYWVVKVSLWGIYSFCFREVLSDSVLLSCLKDGMLVLTVVNVTLIFRPRAARKTCPDLDTHSRRMLSQEKKELDWRFEQPGQSGWFKKSK